MGLGDKAKSLFQVVKMVKKEVVVPLGVSSLIQKHWLPVSNLDLLIPSQLKFVAIQCYKNPASDSGPQASTNAAESFISSLKRGLAQVLVPFYPLAGEVVRNSLGEPEICCNNRGVEFIEAYADIELENLNIHNLDQNFVVGKLVPDNNHDILVVQSTTLKCGSVIVVTLFDHRISDGYSASMFLVSWAEFVRSKPLTYNNPPSFRRSLLNPSRNFGSIDTSDYDKYVTVVTTPENTSRPRNNDNPINRLYYIKAEHINNLQTLACKNNSNNNITKIESFSAFLWKLIAKSSTSTDVEKQCKVGIVVDGRKLLGRGDGKEDHNAMSNFFGNVISIPNWGKRICDLNKEPLNEVARDVHKSLKGVVMKEHFSGLIDWVEAIRPKSGMFRLSSYKIDDGPSIMVSSGLRFSTGVVDFGWGRPILGTFHFPMGMRNLTKGSYVYPALSPIGNGDWVVYMHLFKSQLEFIDKEASNFFKPLTFDYLRSIMDQLPYLQKDDISIKSKI
ncbi:hypothetical protein F8388_023563 [Cannabis sativa]|uniref:Uncharacterized protein n=1 Tax=Cannabis sativa TaxID=3483 RepID=A0A7J6G995_CANSA|nr:hypothetical protein F8388_023563 [Cannabis sativa]